MPCARMPWFSVKSAPLPLFVVMADWLVTETLPALPPAPPPLPTPSSSCVVSEELLAALMLPSMPMPPSPPLPPMLWATMPREPSPATVILAAVLVTSTAPPTRAPPALRENPTAAALPLDGLVMSPEMPALALPPPPPMD